MKYPEIEVAPVSARERTLWTITLGFSADPVARWIWPEAKDYTHWMPQFARAMAGGAFEHASALVANGFRAAALWLPPSAAADEVALSAILEASVRPEIAEDVNEMFTQMDEFHPQNEACWYLPMIAADPAFIGQGFGAALMKHALRSCDEQGAIAYLESSNPRNISLYRRHGFEVVGTIQAGESPPMYPMIREPKMGDGL